MDWPHLPVCLVSQCHDVLLREVVWRVADVDLEDLTAGEGVWQWDVDPLLEPATAETLY